VTFIYNFVTLIPKTIIMDFLKSQNLVINTLKQTGLDWTVKKVNILTETEALIESHNALCRGDNGNVLGVVGNRYVPYQNYNLVELAYLLGDQNQDLRIATGGEFNGGRQVFVQLELPQLELELSGSPKDTALRYITIINGHDGKSSLRFGYTNKLLSCKNMFTSVSRDLQYGVYHSSKIDQRVDAIVRQLKQIEDEERSFYVIADSLSKKKVSRKIVTDFAYNLIGVANREKESKQFERKLEQLLSAIRVEMASKGDNAWGLFNGVTYFTTHMSKVPNRSNSRLESKIIGSGMKLDNRALELVQKL
jgi:phage/plasmid-like protein (TIGR03299 family)